METLHARHSLTIEDLMSRVEITIPQHLPMREAAHLLRHANATSAPVVDEQGRCVGELSVSDLLRWAEEGGDDAKHGRIPGCCYQRTGLIPENPEAVTCMQSEGSCLLQVIQTTTEGHRVALCRDPNCFWSESQLGGESVALAETNRFMTTNLVTAGLQTSLSDLARRMIDTRADRILILDEFGRPAGFVSCTDLLALRSWEEACEAKSSSR